MAYFRFPPLQRGVRGDLGALENPPKSPFPKGGLESVFAWSPANGRLSLDALRSALCAMRLCHLHPSPSLRLQYDSCYSG